VGVGGWRTKWALVQRAVYVQSGYRFLPSLPLLIVARDAVIRKPMCCLTCVSLYCVRSLYARQKLPRAVALDQGYTASSSIHVSRNL